MDSPLGLVQPIDPKGLTAEIGGNFVWNFGRRRQFDLSDPCGSSAVSRYYCVSAPRGTQADRPDSVPCVAVRQPRDPPGPRPSAHARLAELARAADWIDAFESPRDFRAPVRHRVRLKQRREMARNACAAEARRRQHTRHAEPYEPHRVVRLVERHGHHKLWPSGGQRLRRSTNSAVVHQRGRAGQHGAERRVVGVPYPAGQP